MPKWENVTVKISGGGPTAVTDSLNKMGDQGWEAWHLESRPDDVLIFLKRAKPEPVVMPPTGEAFSYGRDPDLRQLNGRKRF